jgi:long-chain acyl-CoA synthetase
VDHDDRPGLDDRAALRTLADLPFFVAGRYPKEAFVDRLRDVALGLCALGLEPGDRLALVSESRPEWLTVDLAAQTLGVVVVPIYPTLTAAQVGAIVADAGARAAVASTAEQLAKLQDAQRTGLALDPLVVMDAVAVPAGSAVLTLDAVAARGHARIVAGWGVAGGYRERARAVRDTDLATLIYTSGTTGEPKGVMLTHGNIVSNLKAGLEVLPVADEDVALSFLPLSHSFERTVVYAYLAAGLSVVFAEHLETIARDILTVRPSVMTGVPRLFEKMRGRILETVARGSWIERLAFRWAIRIGSAWTRATLERRHCPAPLAWANAAARRLVFSKIRDRLGGRVRFLISGSAPLSAALGEFFYAVGVPILEGYGLTETSPVLTVNPFAAPRFGTVGPALPGVELRIADDGEILARGPNVMRGYYGRPDATSAVLRDGWLHTGDIGRLDADGYLMITDRKRDLVVTSGGKKIAPQPIESTLKEHPLVAEAVLLGERRRFPAVLIVPDFPALEQHLREAGRPLDTPDALVARPDVVAIFQALVDRVNEGLAHFEQIKKLAVLPEEFTIERGELTPTMKVRRRVVEERWRTMIEELYTEEPAEPCPTDPGSSPEPVTRRS